MDKKELAEVLREVLHDHRQIDDDMHASHHAYIEMEMKRKERHSELLQKFKLSLVGTAAMAVVGFLIWVGKLVMTAAAHPPGY